MLTYRVVEKIEIPHEPGEWVELKPLSWSDLERARSARLRSVAESVRGIEEAVSLLMNRAESGQPDTDPQNRYDRATLLRAGVVGWSYDATLDEENLAALDEPTAAWIVEQLLGAGQATPNEDDRKNVSSTSTRPSRAAGPRPKSG